MPSLVSHVTSADGTDLLVRHWQAATADPSGDDSRTPSTHPWASVLLVHGLGEHSGRYDHVGDQMAAAGLDVHAYDRRGNGGSGGRRGHVDRWAEQHEDLEERLRAVRLASADRDPDPAAADRPVVLYGHSLGGLVVLGYLLTDRPKPDLVILSSPALDSTLPAWKKVVASILGRVAPTLAIPNGIDGSTLSRDPAVAADVAADPLAQKSSTTRFGAEAFAELVRVRREYRALTLPTLVLHGLDDGLVPAAASEILASLPNVERRTYPRLRHELHNEPEGQGIVAELIEWMRAHAKRRATIGTQSNTASGERIAR